MKIRNGFVSNSSSSSFVIAVRKTNICKHCGRSDSNIIDKIEKSEYCKTEIRNLNCDKLPSTVSPEIKDEVKEKFAQYFNNDEWIVAEVVLDYCDDIRADFVDNPENVVVIYGECE